MVDFLGAAGGTANNTVELIKVLAIPTVWLLMIIVVNKLLEAKTKSKVDWYHGSVSYLLVFASVGGIWKCISYLRASINCSNVCGVYKTLARTMDLVGFMDMEEFDAEVFTQVFDDMEFFGRVIYTWRFAAVMLGALIIPYVLVLIKVFKNNRTINKALKEAEEVEAVETLAVALTEEEVLEQDGLEYE